MAAFGCEAALGLTFGLAMLLLSAGVKIAGQLIAQMSGLSSARVYDPEQHESSSLYGTLLDLAAVAVFLLVGGHRQVVAALLDTFQWMPPGEARFSADLLETINAIVTQSFVLGLRTAAPVIVALMGATLVLGLVSRALPRLNTLALGFSLNTLLVLAVLSLSMGSAAWVFQEHTDQAVQMLQAAFERLSPES